MFVEGPLAGVAVGGVSPTSVIIVREASRCSGEDFIRFSCYVPLPKSSV